LLLAVTAGCGAAYYPKPLPFIPRPLSPESAAIGVELTIKPIVAGFDRMHPQFVHFLRLQEGTPLQQTMSVRPSTLVRGKYAYLLNAEPGRYAVVAGYVGGAAMNGTVYLQELAILASIVDVNPGSFTFMGTVAVDALPFFREPDPVLEHFVELDRVHRGKPDETAPLLQRLGPSSFVMTSRFVSVVNDPATRHAFLCAARGDLESTDWIPMVDFNLRVLASMYSTAENVSPCPDSR
jgi:hypothetical protein